MRRRALAPAIELSPEELARRAKWGGSLPSVPALTTAERMQWQARQEAGEAWVPQRALAFCWANVDPVHGGGRWSFTGFAAALHADRRDIARVCRLHPGQRGRLAAWLAGVDALGQQRDVDSAPLAGAYYRQLAALGYRSDNGTEPHGGPGRPRQLPWAPVPEGVH